MALTQSILALHLEENNLQTESLSLHWDIAK
jgi:hypothetical protein